MLGRFQPRRHAAGQRVARGAGDGARRLPEIELQVAALDLDGAPIDLQVALGNFERVRRDLERLLAHLERRDMRRGAGEHRLAAVRTAETHGDRARIA